MALASLDGSAEAVSPLSSSIAKSHAPVAETAPASPVYPCPDHRPNQFYLYNSNVVLPGYTGRVWITPARNAKAIWNATYQPVIQFDTLDREHLVFVLRRCGLDHADVVLAMDHTEGDLLAARSAGFPFLAPEKPGHTWRQQLNRPKGMKQLRRQLALPVCGPAACKPLPPLKPSMFNPTPVWLPLPADCGDGVLPDIVRAYLGEEKQLLRQFSWAQLQAIAGLRVVRVRGRNALEWPLQDVHGQDLGSREQIVQRGVLHQWFPDRFKPRDNKKVVKGTRVSEHFRALGLTHNGELADYQGRVWIVGGLADGFSVMAATGDVVCAIVGEANARNIAKLIAETYPHLADKIVVALDHDAGGIAACQRSGWPWLMPEQPGDDWNDVWVRDGQALARELRQPPRLPVPDYDLKALDGWRMVQRKDYDTLVKSFQSCTTPRDSAVMAAAIVQYHHRRIPSLTDREAFLEALVHPLLHVRTLDALRGRLDWLLQADLNTTEQHDSLASLTEWVRGCPVDYHRLDPMVPLKRQVDLTPGVHGVKGPFGDQKTVMAADLAKGLMAAGGQVLNVLHRIALTLEQCRVFGTHHYKHLSVEQLPFTQGISTCLPSLVNQVLTQFRRDNPKLKLLVLDEFDKLLDMLASVICKDHCVQIYAALRDTIKTVLDNGGTVYLADADFSGQTVEELAWLVPDGETLHIWDKPWRDQGKTLTWRSGPRALLQNLKTLEMDLLHRQPGECRLVASDACSTAIGINKYLKNALPDLKVLLLHSNNAGNPEQQAFMHDADQAIREQQYDLVIYSPVIDSGTSITVPVIKTYGFSHNVLNAQKFMQQLNRPRTCTDFLVAIDICQPRGGIDREQHFIDAWNRLTQMENLSRAVTDYTGFAARQRAYDNELLNVGGKALVQLCALRQWQVVRASDSEHLEVQQLQEDFKAIKAEQRTAHQQQILQARPIDAAEKKRLENAAIHLCEADVLAIQRYRVCAFLKIRADRLTAADIEFYREHGTDLTRYMTSGLGLGLEVDPSPDNTNTDPAFCSFQGPGRIIYHYLLEQLKGPDNTLPPWDEAQAARVLARCQQVHRDMPYALHVLGILPQSQVKGDKVHWPTSPVRIVNELFRRMGLTVERHQKTVDGKKKSVYRIAPGSLERMQQYALQKASGGDPQTLARIRASIRAPAHNFLECTDMRNVCGPDLPFWLWLRTRCDSKLQAFTEYLEWMAGYSAVEKVVAFAPPRLSETVDVGDEVTINSS